MGSKFKKNKYVVYSDSDEDNACSSSDTDDSTSSSSADSLSPADSNNHNTDTSPESLKNESISKTNALSAKENLLASKTQLNDITCRKSQKQSSKNDTLQIDSSIEEDNYEKSQSDAEFSGNSRQSIVEQSISCEHDDLLVLGSSTSVANESVIDTSCSEIFNGLSKIEEKDRVVEESSDSDTSVECIDTPKRSMPINSDNSHISKEVINQSNFNPDGSKIEPSQFSNSFGSLSKITVGSNNSISPSEISDVTQTSLKVIDECKTLEQQLADKRTAYQNILRAVKCCDPKKLKDGGKLLQEKLVSCKGEIDELKEKLKKLGNLLPDNSSEKYAAKPNNLFSTSDQVTIDLGKKGLETHRVHQALTVDALVSLHNSLETCPSENVQEKDPHGLLVELMPHQKYALAWLLWRERQVPPGGILADDMGLGKTLTMIALVLRSEEYKNEKASDENKDPVIVNNIRMYHGKTLVVCPSSLIGQWQGQIKKHCKPNLLSSLVHHGKPRETRAKKLAAYDIVITSYGVIVEENKTIRGNEKGPLFCLKWNRVIIDEGHVIRNHKTKKAQALCELEAKYRWCLTGTPVQNKELDMYSLLKFLHCSPFDNLTVWKRWVDNKSANGVKRLNTVVKSILLRRTKEELRTLGELKELPNKKFIPVYVKLDEEEQKVYRTVLHFSKHLLAEFILQEQKKLGFVSENLKNEHHQLLNSAPNKIKTTEIFVLLLRLRQICCLPGLIHAMLEKDSCAEDGVDVEDDPIMQDLTAQMRRISFVASNKKVEEEVKKGENILIKSNPVFEMFRPSTKIQTVIKIIKESLEANDKVVVVSQWSSLLQKLKNHILPLKSDFVILDGSVPVKFRPKVIEDFNDPTTNVKIMLLSLTAGGVGLNLCGGNRLVIFEPHWNPQLESQACDRIYRVGQKKPVFIYKIICQDTIEEKIELLQKKKLEVAKTVLKGELKLNRHKITLTDLKILFDIRD